MKVLKIALLSTVAFYSVSSIAAVSLDQGDTMYYFAKDCNKKGKTSYGNTDYGWQPYSASDVYQEYKYMLDMVAINSLMSGSGNSVSESDMKNYLQKTRAKRISAAQSQGALTCR
uniref:hypothetical protein n=1 Tax=Psychrobacter sp. DAB_AL43B TaxID=1028416 RepID=UPI0002571911|nr:hypothetical protein [Psychrobacter sp. DAB_AL43B]AFF18196.1 hypothetical protein [Psychrobacter sp. DAB_AL43B]